MKPNQLSVPLWKRLWRETTDVLSQNGNRIRLMLAILIAAASWLAELLFFQIFLGVWALLEGAGGAAVSLAIALYAALAVGFLIFLIQPLTSGLFYLAGRMEAEEETVLSDLFYAFTGAEAYRSMLACGLYTGVPLAVLIAAPYGVTAALSGWAGANAGRWVLAALLAVGADFLLFFLFLGWFAKPCGTVRTAGRKPMRRAGGWYFGKFLPHLLLSVLSLLIYLLADILPRMLIFYFRFCREYTILSTQPEENQS